MRDTSMEDASANRIITKKKMATENTPQTVKKLSDDATVVVGDGVGVITMFDVFDVHVGPDQPRGQLQR